MIIGQTEQGGIVQQWFFGLIDYTRVGCIVVARLFGIPVYRRIGERKKFLFFPVVGA